MQDILDDIGVKTAIELTDDSDVPQILNDELILSKIDEMSRYIDGFLAERYTLPIANMDDLEILRNICVSLVVTELYRRRLGLDYSDSLQARRGEAIANLERIQRGIIKLKSGGNGLRPLYYRVSSKNKYFDKDIYF